MKTEINALATLAKMEDFRQHHQDYKHPSDWCMRCLEAIVAKEAGYESRNDWTEALRQGKAPEPAESPRDAEIVALQAKVQRLEHLLRQQCKIAGQMERDLTNMLMENRK